MSTSPTQDNASGYSTNRTPRGPGDSVRGIMYASRLRRWGAALANSVQSAMAAGGAPTVTPAQVVAFGDSTLEGWSASQYEYAWPNLLSYHLNRLAYPNNGAWGYGVYRAGSPSQYNGTVLPRFTNTTDNGNFGLGRYAATVAAGGTVASLTTGANFVRAILNYRKVNALVGTLAFAVNGVAKGTATAFDGTLPSLKGRSDQFLDSGAVTATNVLTLTQGTAYASQFCGVILDMVANPCARVLNGGHFGTNNAYVEATTEAHDIVPALTSNLGSNLGADLVVLGHGINEYGAGDRDAAAAFYNSTTSLARAIRAGNTYGNTWDGDLLVVVPWCGASKNATNWRNFVDAAYDAANALGAAVFDANVLLGNVGAADPYGLTFDGTHPLDRAMSLIATSLASALAQPR